MVCISKTWIRYIRLVSTSILLSLSALRCVVCWDVINYYEFSTAERNHKWYFAVASWCFCFVDILKFALIECFIGFPWQPLSWSTKTTQWTFDSSNAPRIPTGYRISWTCSLGLCRSWAKKVVDKCILLATLPVDEHLVSYGLWVLPLLTNSCDGYILYFATVPKLFSRHAQYTSKFAVWEQSTHLTHKWLPLSHLNWSQDI